ncbi:MAG: hypothetical protein LBN94_00120 [Puniceicoccales bacterium]|nr:hypothetical protein [Puniceicoccales bacterium]
MAEEAKSGFIHDMEDIAAAGGGCFSAGSKEEDYPYAVKSEESTQRKVENRVEMRKVQTLITDDLSFPSYVENMGDMLRGTIVVNDYDQMVVAVQKLGEKAREKVWSVGIENKFAGEPKGGYVGLHFNIGYPTNYGMISTEMQIHTKRNLEVKERDHKIYEIKRTTDGSTSEGKEMIQQLTNAATIFYCASMTADLNS